jgi:peptide/nickel transport system permease protein
MKRALRELAWPASLLLGVCVLTFSLTNVAPGDPARTILGLNARQENVDQLRAQLGFDRPLAAQLGSYLLGIVSLDWGNSWLDGRPVLRHIGGYILPTATIGFLASMLSIAVAISLNSLFFIWPHSSRVLMPPLRAGIGVPSFLVAMVAALVSGRLLASLGGGASSGSSSTMVTLLPAAIAAACYPTCLMTALLRDRFKSIALASYFRAAQAAGYSTSALFGRVLLRNSAATLLTAWINQISILAFSTIIVEQVFSVRGIGALLVRSIQGKDLPVIAGIVILNGIFFLVLGAIAARVAPLETAERPLATHVPDAGGGL